MGVNHRLSSLNNRTIQSPNFLVHREYPASQVESRNTLKSRHSLITSGAELPHQSSLHGPNPPLTISAVPMFFRMHRGNGLLQLYLIASFLESSGAVNHRHQSVSASPLIPRPELLSNVPAMT